MSEDVRPFWVEKSDADRRQTLTPEQYRITRQHGAERAFTGLFLAEKGAGTYDWLCCGAPLFRAGERRTQRRQDFHTANRSAPRRLRRPPRPRPSGWSGAKGLCTSINGTARMLDPQKA